MAWSSPDGRGDEMRPLVASLDDSEHDVAANSGMSSSQPQQPLPPPPPPPPVSGHVPSPSSGIHAHRLRHRHQMMMPPPISTPPPRRHHQQLDDADAAAGARAEAPRTASVHPRAEAPRPVHQRSVTEGASPAAKGRSFSHPVHANSSGKPSSPFLSSRSLGSRTPDNHKLHFQSPSLSYDEHMQQLNERHSEEFFNNVGRSPPRTQRMERGLRRGATYGGSEHDFLNLTSRSSLVLDDGSASSSGSYSQNDNMMARKRHHHHHNHPGRSSPRRMHSASIPPLPPLEITTQRGTSCPPYGLPTIEGSPAPADVERKLAQRSLSEAHAAGTVPPPPVSPLTPEGESSGRFVVLGWDMSSYARRSQFLLSAGGTFGFSLLYGYLQELISVELCGRKLGLFLALTQFTGYTILSYFFRKLDRGVDVRPLPRPAAGDLSLSRKLRRWKNWGRLRGKPSDPPPAITAPGGGTASTVPMELYVGLSILRAIDLGMTNLAMQYVNYPAKTLMKSTRVVFTMIFGVIVTKKRYGVGDYGIVGLMVAGLGMFMRADAKTSAVFNPLGIMMLTISLLCDGAISNLSEALMNRYSVGQDEFIFRLYSIATFFICLAAAAKGDLRDGVAYLTSPGTLHEMEEGLDPTWSIMGKILTMVLFSTTGFLSSSCSAAITKSFGALTMSITSTARKATTIFLSFALFPNECTLEHVGGIFLFITSLVAKSLRASRRGRHHHHHHNGHDRYSQKAVAEMDGGSLDASNNALPRSHLRRKVPGDEVV